jgi:hypothetical protein
MNKICKKCGNEMPQNSKKDICDNCQNKRLGTVRKVGEVGLGILSVVGSVALAIVTKGKVGGPKA